MPAYEFLIPEAGQVIELIRPVRDRDKPIEFVRKQVPSRLGVMAAGTPEPTMSEKLLKSYYKLEEQQGSRFQSAFSKKQIKRVHEGL